jgi:hypothetical protein
MLAVIYRRTCHSIRCSIPPAAKRIEEEDNKVVFVFPLFKGISRLCLLTIHSWGIEEGDSTCRLCISILKGISHLCWLAIPVGESKRGKTHIVFVFPFLKEISCLCLSTIMLARNPSRGIEEGESSCRLCNSTFFKGYFSFILTLNHICVHVHSLSRCYTPTPSTFPNERGICWKRTTLSLLLFYLSPTPPPFNPFSYHKTVLISFLVFLLPV